VESTERTPAANNPAPFREFRIGDDPERIRSSFDDNGYLLFKAVLNRDAVLAVKAELTNALRAQGFVRYDAAEPVATPGASAIEVDSDRIYGLRSPVELMASPELQQLVDLAYGETGYVTPTLGIRHVMPADEPYATPPHQDFFYIRESDEFRMVWIPLMDIEIANGGLAIAAGSHRHGLQEHVEFDGVYSYVLKGRRQKGVRRDDIRGTWTSSRVEVGDVLMFHSCAVHKSLPNTSDLVRLALNAITYPARLPRIWQAERTAPELQVFRNELKRICEAEGIDGDLFEEVAIEGMKQGEEPSPQLVHALVERVRSAG